MQLLGLQYWIYYTPPLSLADDVIMSTGYNLCLGESANSTGILWKSFFVSRYEKNCPETAKKKVSIQLFFRLSYKKFFIRISSTHNIILQEGGEYRIKKSWTLLRTGRQLSSPIHFNARFYYASFLCPRVYYEYILHVCMRFLFFASFVWEYAHVILFYL